MNICNPNKVQSLSVKVKKGQQWVGKRPPGNQKCEKQTSLDPFGTPFRGSGGLLPPLLPRLSALLPPLDVFANQKCQKGPRAEVGQSGGEGGAERTRRTIALVPKQAFPNL